MGACSESPDEGKPLASPDAGLIDASDSFPAPDATLENPPDASTPDADTARPDDAALLDAEAAPDAAPEPPDAGLEPSERVLTVVAHPDDDLGLTNPDLFQAIARGAAVQTVFLTSGNSDQPCLDYAQSRERGLLAAYAQMAGRDNQWLESERELAGHHLRVQRLQGAPIELLFVGLSNESARPLRSLWEGELESIQTWPTDTRRPLETYTREGLSLLLQELIETFAPSDLHTNDASRLYPEFWPFDHPEHVRAGLFTLEALEHARLHPTLKMYRAYNTQFEPINLSAADTAQSWAVFQTYAAHDPMICTSSPVTICGRSVECEDPDVFYEPQQGRMYPIGIVRGTGALRGPGQTCVERPDDVLKLAPCSGALVLWELAPDDSLRDMSGHQCVTAPSAMGPLRMQPCTGAIAQRFRVTERGQLRGPGASCAQVVQASASAAEPDAGSLTLATCADLGSQLEFTLVP